MINIVTLNVDYFCPSGNPSSDSIERDLSRAAVGCLFAAACDPEMRWLVALAIRRRCICGERVDFFRCVGLLVLYLHNIHNVNKRKAITTTTPPPAAATTATTTTTTTTSTMPVNVLRDDVLGVRKL